VAKEKHFANSYLLKMLPFLLRRCLRRIPVQAEMIFFRLLTKFPGVMCLIEMINCLQKKRLGEVRRKKIGDGRQDILIALM
jgi:hypothetical protein